MKHSAEHGRGEIKGNAMAALVTSKVYRSKTEKPKKGKGSFKRQAKHKSRAIRLDFFYPPLPRLIQSHKHVRVEANWPLKVSISPVFVMIE